MNIKHVALLKLGHYICGILLIDQFLLTYHIMSVINIKTYQDNSQPIVYLEDAHVLLCNCETVISLLLMKGVLENYKNCLYYVRWSLRMCLNNQILLQQFFHRKTHDNYRNDIYKNSRLLKTPVDPYTNSFHLTKSLHRNLILSSWFLFDP